MDTYSNAFTEKILNVSKEEKNNICGLKLGLLDWTNQLS